MVPTAPDGRSATVNTTSRAPAPFRYPPTTLLLTDFLLLLRNFKYLYTIVWPLNTSNHRGELYLWSLGNLFTLFIHTIFIGLGLGGFLLIPLWIELPGGAWLLVAAAYFVVVWVMAWILNQTREGAMIESLPKIPEVPGEKWMFINGVMAGRWWVQGAIDEIQRRFGRPVEAIHNRTFGVILDLMQCLIQRDLGLTNGCVKETYKQIRTHLLQRNPANPSQWRYNKVIVLAHSQGGLITSLALDMLFADLADEVLSRLEVYTFGNAANHFNNPPNMYKPENGEAIRFPTIKHIEHYANEFDFVSRFGVLAYHPGPSGAAIDSGEAAEFLEWNLGGGEQAQKGVRHETHMEDNQFAGKLFMRKGKGGHQFVMHYLDEMFKDGDGGELVFVPIEVKEETPQGGKADGPVVNTADEGRVKKTNLEETSRLWRYRGARTFDD
ncbi:hypothetical protein FPQ18DRAFT_252040 [Pyronema domesticum]|nr:hypothetical protein FPQ18DRAFT_252040 [Pyronema domesticum]